ncbi:VanZ family protein [Neobacillus muris]|uniref:VanZ family protein n=1 Tax=Neobacillus muris TaxID=2941334 RepID=UPI00203B1A17|nr:VanZ family protein [Neobacillus muris]
MKGLAIFIWMLFIFILTCTASFSELMAFGEIRFRFEARPDLTDLFTPLPEELSNGFIKQKVGHILAFFLFTMLLQRKMPYKRHHFIAAFTYAAFTEIIQLFFARNGRLFDIGFDLAGITLALCFSLWASKSRQVDINSQYD